MANKPKHCYDQCPSCGKRKRCVSNYCRKCSGQAAGFPYAKPAGVVILPSISDAWKSEFRGLFWGEGSALIIPNNQSYSAVLSLNLRKDDAHVVENIHRTLGGRLLHKDRKLKQHAQVQWRVTDMAEVKAICELLLEDVQIRAKKVYDVEAVLDFCNWRLPRLGCRLSDKERAEMKRRYQDLKDSRIL